MNEVKNLQLSLIKYTAIIVAIASVALLVGLQLKAIPYILSLILGGSMSVLTFMLLANTVVKASFMEPGKAQIYMGSQYFIRFSIIAVVLYISTQMPYLNVFATAVGIFIVKGILYIIQLRDQKQQKTKVAKS